MKTKKLLLLIPLLSLITGVTSCEKDEIDKLRVDKSSYYEYFGFERKGGGSLEFNLYKTTNSNYLKAIVLSKEKTEDREKVIFIQKTDDNRTLFEIFNNALDNKIELSGEPKILDESQPSSGTWHYQYFIRKNDTIEVTNSELSKILLEFELMVRNQL